MTYSVLIYHRDMNVVEDHRLQASSEQEAINDAIRDLCLYINPHAEILQCDPVQ